jgi:integrase
LLYPAELRALFYGLVHGVDRRYIADMSNPTALEEKDPKWIKTRVQHVYRHRDSGRYYVRGFRQGKEIWKALKTKSAEVARAQAADVLKEINKPRILSEALLDGKPTAGQAAELYRAQVETDVEIKPRTRDYRLETIKTLFRSWSGLETTRLSQITEAQCREWAKHFLHSKRATGHNWKTEPKKIISASRFNNTVDTLRHIFEIGIKHGVILSNPANAIGKVTPRQKPMRIPTREQFTVLVQEIRNAGGAVSHCSADLVEFLGYTGCRIDESRWVRWEHVDRQRNVVVIWGDPETATKNYEVRRVPIIPPLAKLLDDLRQTPRYPRAKDRRKENYVLAVRECQKAIDRACAKLNIQRFTHHDLRHLFATRCIESGVDIPTVSKFLGHKDGGALAMKTYGHLQDGHAQAMAAKVKF